MNWQKISPGGGTYYDYLVCKIYRDLVAATDIPVARIDNEGAVVGTPPERVETDDWSWTIIPQSVQQVVRLPIT